MNTATQAAAIAIPFVGAGMVALLARLVLLIGAGRFVRLAEEVEKDAPIVEAAVRDVERIPEVHKLTAEAEATIKAEAERLNAATHGALDALASELAKALPEAVSSAVVAAKATVAAQTPSTPSTPSEPVPATDTPAEASAALETPSEPAPAASVPGAPVVTTLSAAAPA